MFRNNYKKQQINTLRKYIKRVFLMGLLILSISGSLCYGQQLQNRLSLIPMPQEVNFTSGLFVLNERTSISTSDEQLQFVRAYFKQRMIELFSLNLNKDEQAGGSSISFQIDQSLIGGEEAYQLSVSENKIEIRASEAVGVFYGVQSLLQLLYSSSLETQNPFQIPCCEIKDSPRYEWRGFMLDESRHFFGMKKVKQLLDLMAYHKLNRFHWHLTDTPGWRIEIKKYPRLCTVGGIGNLSNPNAKASYYSQEEIEEIVNYAAERFIMVIPEIDMPGHAAAANRAYPEYSGGGSEKHPEFTFNPGKEETYTFLEDILKEVVELFPSPYIHFGGDEVHFGNENWSRIPEIKELMRKEKLLDLKAVEKYFSLRMAHKIDELGKVTVGWDEIVGNKLNQEKSLVMWWRHDHPEILKEALSQGYTTILCPRIPLYFDFVQHDSHEHGRRWKGFGDLQKVYNYPVLPEEITLEESKLISGIQANLWTETIQNEKRFDFMTFPRFSALAESAWTNSDSKNYENFLVRLKPMLNYYEMENINYFNPFYPQSTPEPVGYKKP